ncbi:hypothetical protein FRC07_000970 [Ceratobasidium sp. 392]|nr:hypothetical protein FRC07_000970 [Ceratobasidium sp. 392]
MGNAGKGRFHIKFPLDLAWYREQQCTKFRSLRHHKERTGLQHEFLVLELTDGSICRLERMGDPEARFEAISAEGTVACDVAQSFSSHELSNAHLDTSDMVASITFPSSFDLLDVLRICRAIHEGEKTCNYTLQSYNCYFFALAIQAILTALVRGWDRHITNTTWCSAVNEALGTLNLLHWSDQDLADKRQPPVILLLCRLLGVLARWPTKGLRRELCSSKVAAEASTALRAVLWHSNLELAVDYVLCRRVRNIVAQTLLTRESGLSAANESVTDSDNTDSDNTDSDDTSSDDTGSDDTSRPCPEYRSRRESLIAALLDQAVTTHENLIPASKFDQLRRHVALFEEFQPLQAQYWLTFTMGNLNFRRASERIKSPQSDASKLISPQPNSSDPESSLLHFPEPQTSAQSAFWPSVFPLLKTQITIGWLVYARMLLLWGLQLALKLFHIGPLWPEQSPQGARIVEDELDSILAEARRSLRRSPENFLSSCRKGLWRPWRKFPDFVEDINDKTTKINTIIESKVHALVYDEPELPVCWNQWPWTPVYQPIRQRVLNLAIEERKLKVVLENSSTHTAMSVSAFQEHLLERIRLHSERVESFGLGNAARIRNELEDKMSQVWALIRNNDDREWELDTASGWLMQGDWKDAAGSLILVMSDFVECLSKLGCKNITDRIALVDEFPHSSGEFCNVQRGELIADGSAIAFKVMRLWHGLDAGRFQSVLSDAAREAYIWSRCWHPNVLPLFGLAEFGSDLGLVSPWMSNGPLPRYLKRHPECVQICEGLSYLHRIGIVHGDVQGDNVLVSDDGRAVLANFENSWLQKLTHTADEPRMTPRWAVRHLGRRNKPRLITGPIRHLSAFRATRVVLRLTYTHSGWRYDPPANTNASWKAAGRMTHRNVLPPPK